MDPTKTPNPNFDLPPVQLPEVAPAVPQQMTEQLNMESPARTPAAPPPQTAHGTPQANPASNLMPTPPVSQAPATISMPITGTLPATDSDLIEKAWVKTAKAIIEQTREDPYKQNKEITQVKAEYVKKRYNKDIKINDSGKGD